MSVGVISTACSISRPLASTMTVLKDIAEGDLSKEEEYGYCSFLVFFLDILSVRVRI
jgi:hypothetical protein